MNIILIFTLFVGLASAKYIVKYSLEDARAHFEEFIKTYNKEYDEVEKAVRYEIFVKNLDKINKYNENSNHTEFGITQFADLTPEEFVARHTGYKIGDLDGYCTSSEDDLDLKPVQVPEEFDWRSQGKVSPVKNQHDCGSCWAFSTTGNVESAYAIKTGQMLSLSEQQLIDCDKQSTGCTSGLPAYAIKYLQQNGAMSEDSYPYENSQGQCRFDEQKVQVQVKGCASIQASEDQLLEKLVQIGPLSITVDSTEVQSYKGGIMTGDYCRGYQVNHAVLLVGYGKGEDGTPYWLIKNSWGEGWGDKGYFKIHRGVNCVLVAERAPVTAVIA
ncbi:chymomexicain-like [Melitaea cinxia]|uniref:chymomexicain-like n=1 Tax=Melitaea cinxia TaxID=113334 RepID=UPI001E26EEF7|nr:chymomexicain-like [Melitaea cinxia]